MMVPEAIADARRQARALHRRIGRASIGQFDVDNCADHLNVQIVEATLDGALAELIVNGRSARILLSRRLRDPARRRFAIAHELGHYVLAHLSPSLAEICQPSGHQSHASIHGRDLEREADCFARELLLPADAVDALSANRAPDLALCTQLASSASAPIEHAAMRIAERSDHVCAAVLSTSACVTEVAPSYRFCSEFATSLTSTLREGSPLDPRTLAWRILNHSAPCLPTEVPAQAWLGAAGLPLLESPVASDRETILTLLWASRLEDAQATARPDGAAI